MNENKQDHHLKYLSEDIQSTKLHLVAKSINIGLWDIKYTNDDPTNIYNQFNFSDKFRNLLGFENEKDFPNIFKSQVDCIHPDDKQHVLDTYLSHILDTTGKTPYDLQYRMIKKNGEIGFFRDVGETKRDENGKGLFTAGALIDLTEDWKKRQALDLQMLRIDLMISATGLGSWELDIELVNGKPSWKVLWTEKFRNMIGFDDENDFPNTVETMLNIIHPEDKHMVLDALDNHLKDKTGNTSYSIEYRIRKKTGEYIYIHDYAKTIRDEHGNALHTSGAMQDITETKNMQLENQYNINKLNMVIRATNLGIWEMSVVDEPFSPSNIFTFSDGFRNLLGFKNEQDFPNTYYALANQLHPDDAQMVLTAFGNHLTDTSGNTPYNIEYRIIKKDGSVAYFHATADTIRDKNGNPLHTVGALNDITELRQTIITTKSHVNRLNMVVEATKMGLWEMKVIDAPFSPNNEFIWNNILRKLLGYENEVDFPNTFHALAERLHPEDEINVFDKFTAHLLDFTGNTPYDIEYRVFRKNGEIAHFRSIADTSRDENGKPLFTVGMLMDITYIKHAISENELQMSKMLLAVQAAKIGLWEMKVVEGEILNPKNEFIYTKELRHMLGFEGLHDFPNIMESYINVVHKDDIKRLNDTLRNHVLDTTCQTPYFVEDIRIKLKTGEWRYFNDSGISLRDDSGKAIYTLGALIDITDSKNLIIESEKLRFEAEKANVAKSKFLSTISHEIRTPLNAILGITEIELQKKQNKETIEAYEKIYTSGDLLLGIINDILDLSKIEAGKFELNNSKYEIASLISDTAQLNMMRIGSKAIEFELEISENLPFYLIGDELRVKQILNNLLSNAFKYTEKGTVKIKVYSELGENKDEEILTFIVSDTGQGMTEDQVDKLFDEYSRFNIESNRNTEGTGLGMSITRNLVQLMGGNISVKSELNKGTEIIIKLPQKILGPKRIGKEISENLKLFRTRSMAQMKRTQITREPMPYGKILIVDDVETNIYVAKGLMSPYQLSIDSVNSGFDAIEKIKAGNKYDIIFMDHMMPQMDGIETTKHLRDMNYNSPIVALTANAVSGQEQVFLNNGFNGFISKPIDIRQLNSVINSLVRDKHPLSVVEAAREMATNNTSNTPEKNDISTKMADIFLMDANRSLIILEDLITKNKTLTKEDLRTYTIHVHGLKSALSNIGKKDISSLAMKLEELGRKEDLESIATQTPIFLAKLRNYMEEIAPLKHENISNIDEDTSLLKEKLQVIIDACKEYDDILIDETLEFLNLKKWSQPTMELLSFISKNTLLSGFDEISDEIKKFLSERTST